MYKRKLLGERALTAREYHECDVEEPDCVDSVIFPGDRYIQGNYPACLSSGQFIRETWVIFGILDDGSKFRHILIIKRHDSPCCKPDSKLFEEGEEEMTDSFELSIAA